MRVKLQRIMCSDDGHEDTITDIVTLQKESQRIEHLGLTIREAKQLLSTIQKRLLQHQFDAFLDACSTCPAAAPLSKPKVIIPVRSAPCLTPSNLPVQSLPLPLSTAQDHNVPASDVSAQPAKITLPEAVAPGPP